jgi:hypothetical protein
LINLECTRHQSPVAPGCQLSPFSRIYYQATITASRPGIQIMKTSLRKLTVAKVLPAPTSMSHRCIDRVKEAVHA